MNFRVSRGIAANWGYGRLGPAEATFHANHFASGLAFIVGGEHIGVDDAVISPRVFQECAWRQ